MEWEGGKGESCCTPTNGEGWGALGATNVGVVLTWMLEVIAMLKGVRGHRKLLSFKRGEVLPFDMRNVKSTFIWSMWDMTGIT